MGFLTGAAEVDYDCANCDNPESEHCSGCGSCWPDDYHSPYGCDVEDAEGEG